MIFMLSGFFAVAFCLCMYTSGLLCCGILFVYVYIMAFLLWNFVCVCTHQDFFAVEFCWCMYTSFLFTMQNIKSEREREKELWSRCWG